MEGGAALSPPDQSAWIKQALGASACRAYVQEGGVSDVLGDGSIQLWRYAPNQRGQQQQGEEQLGSPSSSSSPPAEGKKNVRPVKTLLHNGPP